jgi:hypothetical protein
VTVPPAQAEANDDVGMSLMAGEETDAVIELLGEDLGPRLRVTDCITYRKLETDAGYLEVRFDDVAERLGRRFTMADFQAIFSSYYGRPSMTDEWIRVDASMTAGVLDDE